MITYLDLIKRLIYFNDAPNFRNTYFKEFHTPDAKAAMSLLTRTSINFSFLIYVRVRIGC